MTREEAKELLPIIQAFAEGKTIQVWYNDTWQDEEYPSFGELSLFRIKPEPKYRPFKTKEECWNEMLKHQPFCWLKDIDTGGYIIISELYDEDSDVNGNTGWDYVGLMKCYTFADGTTFGLKEVNNE